MNQQAEKQRLIDLSDRIFKCTQSISILSHVGWPSKIKHQFFKDNAGKIPEVEYPQFDAQPILDNLAKIQAELGDTLIDNWFKQHIHSISNSSKMLASCATPDFYRYSCELFGKPKDSLKDETSNSLDMANNFNLLLQPIKKLDLGAPPKACHLAETVADKMRVATQEMFGAQAPRIEIVDELSANALAGSERIRIRRTACFTDKDIDQLIQHEAYVHVATLLNGANPLNLKLLAAVQPRSTKTQEGLAVFAEFISGSMDLDRMRRLSDRVIAIQMSIDGADFMEVYRYFLSQTGNEEQSFENARRVFRGGVLTGGAPFTKDIVYLDGLARVHCFLRAIVNTGRADCLRFLFAGRLDVEDMPVICELYAMGLCQLPKFLPPWVKDLRFLLSYLVYSSFLNKIDMSKVSAHYKELLGGVPPIEIH